MPSVLSMALRPERRRPSPAPLAVDLRRVVLAGMALWAVALVVCLLLWWRGGAPVVSLWVCGAGIALGVLGLDWDRRHR